ncbi:MAG TPA: DUF4956 domain-containing protein [Longimicrobiales bacterium]|nr:DUF4956 domain-containing protein [Longimicrobiales bacterium]
MRAELIVQQAPQVVDVDSLLQANARQNSFVFDSPVPLPELVVVLVIGLVLALLVRWHFRRYASALASRHQFSIIFPTIVLTTLLIITIVKSSLALSLGLVGALSIVRFRTPIKEPEELAYLFVCIAIGLGLGANQIAATVGATLFILLATGLVKSRQNREEDCNLHLSVTWAGDESGTGSRLDKLSAILREYASYIDLRRVDTRGGVLEANFLVSFDSHDRLSRLLAGFEDAQEDGQQISVSFIDQSRALNV